MQCSNQCKRSTLFSEGIKRLVNCSPELPWTTKAKHLSKFSFSLKSSGYSHKYRVELKMGVIAMYKEMQGKVFAGERSWYRTRQELQQHKVQKGRLSAATWFLTDTVTQTLYLPITPGSELLKEMKEKLKERRDRKEVRQRW